MNTKWLGPLGILLAVGCWSVLIALRHLVFRQPFAWTPMLVELSLVTVGSIIFWRWIIATLERQAAEVRQRTHYLEALHSASMALTTEHDITLVLQKVVDLSRNLINAKYGALGVLDEDGDQISQMVTSGMSATARAAMERFPHGHGLLGVPIRERRPVRVDDITAHTGARGFPANHPIMHTFLGVPIVSKGRMFGNLYMSDKLPGPFQPAGKRGTREGLAFSREDQDILEMFANQAAIAIENAQLYRQNEQLAIVQERERFGMDLHDGIIQSIYAIGLMLDDSRHRLADDPETTRKRLDEAIAGLNQVIVDIRSYIHDLRTHQFEGRNLQQGLEELARDLQTYSILKVDIRIDPTVLKRIGSQQSKDLIHIAREALTNIRKHAHATHAEIRLSSVPEGIMLEIQDNGVGLNGAAEMTGPGHGLRNMRDRALNLNGRLKLDAAVSGGARVEVVVPYSSGNAYPRS